MELLGENIAQTVFDVLKNKLIEEKNTSIEFLGSGGAKDFSQYKDVTGFIRGLEISISHMEDLLRNQMEDEDE